MELRLPPAALCFAQALPPPAPGGRVAAGQTRTAVVPRLSRIDAVPRVIEE